MYLSNKSKMYLIILIELALHYHKRRISTAEIAQRHRLSKRSLESFIQELHAGNFLLSYKGKNGGLELATPPREIFLWDIIQFAEGWDNHHLCLQEPQTCGRCLLCRIEPLWKNQTEQLRNNLHKITLQDLTDHYLENSSAGFIGYYI